MQHIFEIYLTADEITQDKWQQVHKIICEQLGVLAKYQIIISFEENVVRYFVASNRDLGQLSNNIEIGVLRPIKKDDLALPDNPGREGFVKFITGGNILDLKEKTGIKRGRHLQYAVFNIRQINAGTAITTLDLLFKGSDNSYTRARKKILYFPSHLLAIDFKVNTGYLRKTPPKYLNVEKTIQLFEPTDANALFSINGFPFSAKDYYLPIHAYEFDKHSFIIGASGSGKSKFIELFIDRLSKSSQRTNYRVIVIDPHDSLRQDLENIDNSYVVNFANESAELFGGEVQTDVSAATELTTSLMKSLLADQFNPKLERVLRFSLFVLFVGQAMSLGMLKRFLTEIELRNQILSHTEKHVPQNIRQFFATDFNEIRTTQYTEAILPIVSLVDEMQLQPTLVSESEQSLAALIKSKFLTVFSLNKVSMGEKVVKTVAGLLVQQIFLLAQARSFNERVILIIDEVSVVQNPALASILSEARKFNLSVILTQQYFGQVEEDLRNAIFANVYNYYAFRVSEEDARALVGNLNMEIPKEISLAEKAKGIKEEELKIHYMTELHPREALIRVSANGQVLPVFKGRTMDIGEISNAPKVTTEDLDNYTAEQPKQKKLPTKFVEGQNRPEDSLSTLPSSPPATPSPAPSGPPAIEQKPTENFPDLPIETTQPTSAPATEQTGPSSFEFDSSIAENPEIDPDMRKAHQQKKKDSSDSIGKLTVQSEAETIPNLAVKEASSKNSPMSVLQGLQSPETMATNPQTWHVGPTGPAGRSVSLSELLASQTSNEDVK